MYLVEFDAINGDLDLGFGSLYANMVIIIADSCYANFWFSAQQPTVIAEYGNQMLQ